MSPLIERLIEEHHWPRASEENIEQLLGQHEVLVLFFSSDPARYPESNDVAVILAELARTYDGRFQPVVVTRSSEQALKARYPFQQWPTLVFLRRGVMLGAISKVRDWAEYHAIIDQLLAPKNHRNSRSPRSIYNVRSQYLRRQ